MPLVVEKIGEQQISLCHYGEQNGDAMRDPEVGFLVSRWTSGNDSSSRSIMEAKPVYFRNDWIAREHCTVEGLFGDVPIKPSLQKQLDGFCGM
jgi:hypothetical protein